MFDDLDPETLRRRTGLKWAAAAPGVLPAWIADMDFPVADPVREVLRRGAEGDLGYPEWDDRPGANPLRELFTERMRQRYDVALDPAHVRVFTELIQTLQAVLHVATRPGDAVAMHTPAYPPFLKTLADMDRRLVPLPMLDGADGWSFDVDRLAADVAEHGCRAIVLVNPHNPTGRALTREELSAIAEIAERHDLLVISDEIHGELVHAPARHIPFTSLGEDVAARTVTLTSASKAFNLAGLRCSVAHIGHAGVRRALDALPPLLFGEVSSLSVLATAAAWRHGDDWLAEVLATLDRNRLLLAESLPQGVRHHTPEATYLAWLDCRGLGLGQDPAAFFLDRAGVMLNSGLDFGPGGEGFARLNFATSGPVLEEILRRLRAAVHA
ncbi:aminotransferase class I/II-fold pyridoxal phosphate-dependent enzyme [Streptomyces sp. LX-29]|uniref:MalY/PatB family protein n=1 Tax=Streptomyces sp. LX-29 TaxID=2900152 RepID=UPI00240D5942|nr:aminotransferase class I/II-fold pyridoxal phosphate-dependent enzyme [Streptomyces sp. LX-29]WFB10621.1 aminotransferase class I/II-fold pyridoxal phosphate-dependent enzyme [Streptomyces sp. LX-29]